MSTNDAPSNRDNLSSVSTILGLALFCLLIATILVRRVMVHRATRRYARHRLLAAANAISSDGGGGGGGFGGSGVFRRGDDSLEDDEPRTIAIGARAALMKRPILWEQHLSLPYNPLLSEKRMEGTGSSCWDRIQPTALQLITPHTTAHFPKPLMNRTLPSRSSLDPSSSSPRRLSRAYERFLFHRDHSPPAPSVPPLQIHTALASWTRNAPPPSSLEPPAPPLTPPPANIPEPTPNRPTSLHSQLRISTTVDDHTAAVENQSASVEQRSLGGHAERTSLLGAETPQEAPRETPQGAPREILREKRTVSESEDGVHPHPVHLTFLISMPDPTASTSTASHSHSPSNAHPSSNSQSQSHWNANGNWNSDSPNLPPLTLGTTRPIAHLPSLLINQDDLDSWWDLPTSRPNVNLNPSRAIFNLNPSRLDNSNPSRPNNLNIGRSLNSTANANVNATTTTGRTPVQQHRRILNGQYTNGNENANVNGNGNQGQDQNQNQDRDQNQDQDQNGNQNGNLSAGQILQLEIVRRVADEREREMEQERVLSEGIGGHGGAGAGAVGRSNVFAGYSGLVRAAGVRRI